MAGRVGVTGHSIPGATGGIWGCAGPVLVDKNPEGESASDWPDDPWKTWPEFYSSCSLSGLPQSWRTANTRNQLFQSQLKKPEWTKYILGIVGAILCVYLKVFTLEKKTDKTGLIDMIRYYRQSAGKYSTHLIHKTLSNGHWVIVAHV